MRVSGRIIVLLIFCYKLWSLTEEDYIRATHIVIYTISSIAVLVIASIGLGKWVSKKYSSKRYTDVISQPKTKTQNNHVSHNNFEETHRNINYPETTLPKKYKPSQSQMAQLEEISQANQRLAAINRSEEVERRKRQEEAERRKKQEETELREKQEEAENRKRDEEAEYFKRQEEAQRQEKQRLEREKYVRQQREEAEKNQKIFELEQKIRYTKNHISYLLSTWSDKHGDNFELSFLKAQIQGAEQDLIRLESELHLLRWSR